MNDSPQVRMQVQADGRQDEPASLQHWLNRESALRGLVKREHKSLEPGELGAVADVLVVSLGNGGAVTALAASLGTWLVTRRSRVTIKVTGPDGQSVQIDARSNDVPALLRSVLPEPGEADR